MFPTRYRPIFVVTMLTGSAVALASGCAETSIEVGTLVDQDAGPQPPSFTPVDSGSDAEGSAQTPLQLCIATTCPAPFDTCGDSFRCGTNLSNDPKNCGACGKECPSDLGYYRHLTSTCVNGTCEPVCAETPIAGGSLKFADCNKVLEDGCEVGISTDPNNCGACGNKCADGVRCIDGKCGCPPGQLDCDGQCTDVRNNDDHCGACGNACNWPADAGEPPPNMVYGCVDNQCGQLKCLDFSGYTWADCDKNQENGCEVFIGLGWPESDRNNCGACGNECTAEQVCTDVTGDYRPECLCTNPHETMCGNIDWGDINCVDLLNDIENCGTCRNRCSTYGDHTTTQCRKGLCEIECAPGWGDCDNDPRNGCETNLKASDGHCGACGNRCDTQAGQPCVDGTCAMTTECDAGRGPQ